MSSSSWHLIHGSGPDAGRTGAEGSPGIGQGGDAPSARPTVAPRSSGAVLRGRMHSSTHSSTGAGLQATALGLPGMDPVQLAEEIGRIEREAEERGYETGRRRAEAELSAAVEGAGALAAEFHAVAPERTSDIAHAIAELALSVARRVVQHEVRVEPSLLCGSLEAAVGQINGSPEAHVLLNPAAVEPVRASWEALHGRAYLGKRWIFEGDPTLPPGGCSVRYDHGFVEAGLEAQLEEIGIALDRAIPGLARVAIQEDVA